MLFESDFKLIALASLGHSLAAICCSEQCVWEVAKVRTWSGDKGTKEESEGDEDELDGVVTECNHTIKYNKSTKQY